MFDVVNNYVDQWKRKGGGRIYVWSKFFGEAKQISIEVCFGHWLPKTPEEFSDYFDEDSAVAVVGRRSPAGERKPTSS
jgi:hypothetical protein